MQRYIKESGQILSRLTLAAVVIDGLRGSGVGFDRARRRRRRLWSTAATVAAVFDYSGSAQCDKGVYLRSQITAQLNRMIIINNNKSQLLTDETPPKKKAYTLDVPHMV
ncbi:hypothetical protein L1987_35744 [Smallanthus sonchifolius]|uniref:Uncharacterized protein n=1 Tax=Smallanthus sonchifolius TaxID=185202 RepID=A0ACB9HD88_9ASTR|nr:hypothetical protein L1987_35744 [Smallanthus sonchifolius]